MEDLYHSVSITHEAEFANLSATQSVAPNSQNPAIINVEMEMHISNIPALTSAISIEPEPPFSVSAQLGRRRRRQGVTIFQFIIGERLHGSFHSWLHNYTGILYLIYTVTLLYMFPSMISLVSLKFQNKQHSPFETHGLLANMAVVAYMIAIPMPVALFCLKARVAKESIYYRILQSVFCFWSLLAPLSFVLVLFLPHEFDFIGCIIVVALFIVVVGCSFSNYIQCCKKVSSILEAHNRYETESAHTAFAIAEE